jgi:phytoene synthase
VADRTVASAHAAIRDGSRSFAGASRLFDPATREAAWLLYSWCRHCDDEVDCEVLGHRMGKRQGDRVQRLARLYERTRAALRGEPMSDPVFEAFQRVASRYAIPERYALELLDGFAMDVEARTYDSLEDLLLYCYHVAGTVGLMMAHIMGVSDISALRRAADLGIALQLTNIARDVIEDARNGRVYLPLEWLARVGVPRDEVGDERHREGVSRVVVCLLLEADRYYRSGDRGLGALSFRSAWAVAAARHVYSAIGTLVRSRGARAWDQRAVVSRKTKILGITRALVEALRSRRSVGALPETDRATLWTERRLRPE